MRWPVVLLVLGLFYVSTVVPGVMRARARGTLTGCKSNLKNLASELEQSAYDHDGRYPVAWEERRCPGGDGYSVELAPRGYTLACSGRAHSVPGFPQYTSVEGLRERP